MNVASDRTREAPGVKHIRSLGPNQVALRLSRPDISTRISLRGIKVCAALVVAIAVIVTVNVSVGRFAVPLTKVVPAMLGLSDRTSNFIVQTLRLPESLDAILSGLAFGMSGAIFQSVTRNPLASPDVLGIESGAATAAVFIIVVVGSTPTGVAGAALVGGLLTGFTVYLLSYRRSGAFGYRLVLIGISIAYALTGVTSYLLTRATYTSAQQAFIWLSGSLNNRGWSDSYPVGIALLLILPLAPTMSRQLGVLQLRDETARGLGVRVEMSRRTLLLLGTALAAAATASAGPVVFVALVAPHLARRVTRTTSAALVPAALVGAALMCGADLAGRMIPLTSGLPVGVITAILGAPYFLWLLTGSNGMSG